MSTIRSVGGHALSVRPTHAPSTGPSAASGPERDGRVNQFDHIALSQEPVGTRRFQRELVSRMSQEVRAVTTTGHIQALRQQIARSEYKPDAAEIASRLLLLRGTDL